MGMAKERRKMEEQSKIRRRPAVGVGKLKQKRLLHPGKSVGTEGKHLRLLKEGEAADL